MSAHTYQHKLSKSIGSSVKRGRKLKVLEYEGGRTRLPKSEISAKFPIGLHVILQIQIKKSLLPLIIFLKKYFNRKSVGVQP